MAMATGGTGDGPQSDINMTPMIDVLLVLLIIFLVIQPSLQQGIKVEVPSVQRAQATDVPDQVIMRVGPGPTYSVNGTPVDRNEIAPALDAVLEGMPDRVVFVSGSERITYGDVVSAIDAARRADIRVIGLVPRSEMGGMGDGSP